MTTRAEPLPELTVAGGADWRKWLDKHHADSPGVRLVLAKKGTSGPTSLIYQQALPEALSYGWIDGQGTGAMTRPTSCASRPAASAASGRSGTR